MTPTKEDIKKCLEDNYVCVKYDMKVGEGLVLAKKWNMEFYPVCLLVNPDGGIRHRIEGLVDPEFFLDDFYGPSQYFSDAGNRACTSRLFEDYKRSEMGKGLKY